jgi:membrane-bound serine protease (ClpP class)
VGLRDDQCLHSSGSDSRKLLVELALPAFRLRAALIVITAQLCLTPAPLPARVLQVDVDGIISPVTSHVISSALAQAGRDHADAVLIRLSTPGGLMDATRDIVQQIFSSPVPVIVWTGPSGARAASAGFFLLEAGDVAAMAPGTNTGASHPVLFGGAPMDPVMTSKVENDAAALMRTITLHRARNQQAAEKTVRTSASFTETEALDQHLTDVIAPDPSALISQLNGREINRFDGRKQTLHFTNPQINVFIPSFRDRLLNAIADPNVALLILVIGILGIYVEFSSPGLVAPGVGGAILVLLALTALAMFPIDWLGAALMILGLAFFVLEAKFTTHGVLTTGGAVALALGAMMLVDTNVPELRVHWITAIGLAIPFALITSFLLSIAVRARRNKVVTGVEGMIGLTGTAVGELNLGGTVLVRGEYWSAQASARVPASEPVRITGIDGLTLTVRPENVQHPKEA